METRSATLLLGLVFAFVFALIYAEFGLALGTLCGVLFLFAWVATPRLLRRALVRNPARVLRRCQRLLAAVWRCDPPARLRTRGDPLVSMSENAAVFFEDFIGGLDESLSRSSLVYSKRILRFVGSQVFLLIKAWLQIQPILLAGLIEATGCTVLLISSAFQFGVVPALLEALLIGSVTTGALGAVLLDRVLLGFCGITLSSSAMVMALTRTPWNVASGLTYGAIGVWLISVGLMFASLVRGSSGRLRTLAFVLAAVGMLADAAGCVATTPYFAELLRLGVVTNQVSWWTLAPIPGQLWFTFVFMTAARNAGSGGDATNPRVMESH